MITTETIAGLCIGIALAAACGFRVFVPLLAMSLGVRAGIVNVGDNFGWLAGDMALIALSAATVMEIGAYFVPWIDHALDTIATPAAIVAGTLATASQVDGMHPMLTWLVGIFAGGGVAGITQAATVGTRGVSTVGTGGLLNPILGVLQSVVSVVLSALAVVVPILAVLVLVLVVAAIVTLILLRRRRRARRTQGSAAGGYRNRREVAMA